MEKYKNLTKLTYVLIFAGILLFFGYMSTANIILGITALVASYAAMFIYYYVHYKFTGEIKWFNVILSIILGVIILFYIV